MPQVDDSEPRIPDKKYFRIGEVSRFIGVPTYVLRFWETEFPRIKPRRTDAGQRVYHRNDMIYIMQIKSLLYDQQFTIKGARKHLDRMTTEDRPDAGDADLIGLIRSELQTIRDLLERNSER